MSKFRTRFLFSDVEFGWDNVKDLNWVGTNAGTSENLDFKPFFEVASAF